MKKLEKEKVLPVKWLIHDIFYRGGILKENYRSKVNKEFGNEKYLISEEYTESAKRICEVLSKLHFKYLDYTFSLFNNVKVYVVDKNMKKVEDMYTVRLTKEDLMLGIAMVCKNLDLYFDTSKYSLFEMGKLIKFKGFAAALALYGCFNQDIYNDINFTPSKVVHPRDLKGNVTIDNNTKLYFIKYNKKDSNEKYISVRPFTNKGNYKLDDTKFTNELFIERKNKYFTNRIYFNNLNDAITFLNDFKKINKFSNLDSLSIVEITTNLDSSVYYKIGTRLGDVLISKEGFDNNVNNYYVDSKRLELFNKLNHPNHPPRSEKEWEDLRSYLSDCQKYYN